MQHPASTSQPLPGPLVGALVVLVLVLAAGAAVSFRSGGWLPGAVAVLLALCGVAVLLLEASLAVARRR